MMKTFIILAVCTIVVILVCGCEREEVSVPVVEPEAIPEIPCPVCEDQMLMDMSLWSGPVIEGRVERFNGSFTGDVYSYITIGMNGDKKKQFERYSMWSVKVKRYLIELLDHDYLTIRTIEGYVTEDDEPLPARFPIRLSEGEHVILFLSKGSRETLPDDEYTVFGKAIGSHRQKLVIDNGMVSLSNREKIEADEFIARLQQCARAAGRVVPP